MFVVRGRPIIPTGIGPTHSERFRRFRDSASFTIFELKNRVNCEIAARSTTRVFEIVESSSYMYYKNNRRSMLGIDQRRYEVRCVYYFRKMSTKRENIAICVVATIWLAMYGHSLFRYLRTFLRFRYIFPNYCPVSRHFL